MIGVAGLATFNFSLQATSTTEFCSSCHADNAAKEWKQSKHFANAQGVQVGCPDCHLPHAFGPKMIRKVQAVREVWGHFAGTIGTAEKYEAHRMEMAKSEWARLKANGAQECKNCHVPENMTNPEKAFLKAMHVEAIKGGQICTDCHQGVAHKAPEEKKETPSPAAARN